VTNELGDAVDPIPRLAVFKLNPLSPAYQSAGRLLMIMMKIHMTNLKTQNNERQAQHKLK